MKALNLIPSASTTSASAFTASVKEFCQKYLNVEWRLIEQDAIKILDKVSLSLIFNFVEPKPFRSNTKFTNYSII